MNFWPGPAPRFIFTLKDIQVLEGLLEILNITYYKPVRRTRTGAGIFFSTIWCFGPRYLQYTSSRTEICQRILTSVCTVTQACSSIAKVQDPNSFFTSLRPLEILTIFRTFFYQLPSSASFPSGSVKEKVSSGLWRLSRTVSVFRSLINLAKHKSRNKEHVPTLKENLIRKHEVWLCV